MRERRVWVRVLTLLALLMISRKSGRAKPTKSRCSQQEYIDINTCACIETQWFLAESMANARLPAGKSFGWLRKDEKMLVFQRETAIKKEHENVLQINRQSSSLVSQIRTECTSAISLLNELSSPYTVGKQNQVLHYWAKRSLSLTVSSCLKHLASSKLLLCIMLILLTNKHLKGGRFPYWRCIIAP